MIYAPLGAADEIGASCHYLQIDGTGILLDTGTDPEAEGLESLPRLDIIADDPDLSVDHVFVSHAHHDHLGSLPVVLRYFPHAQIHMTRATRQLADILLPASARLQSRKVREGSSTADAIFDEAEIEACSYMYTTHELDVSFDVTGARGNSPVRATLLDAGHVLGACGVLIDYEDSGVEKKLFYTSDTGSRSQTIIPGARYPDQTVDVLILESTLGADADAELVSRRTEEKKLGESISAVLKRGGAVLLPVFALGRGQEIIALVDRFKNRGLIPEETPVYTAGLMRAISDIYDKTRFTTPRLNEDFEVYGVPQRRLPRSQSALRQALDEPSIHIVGSGMMFERTISNRLAQKLVDSERNAVFLVGYTRHDSPARMLLDAAAQGPGTEVVLDRATGPQEVYCDVDRFRFSGHSHRRDLIKLVEGLAPRTVILAHGDEKARDWMRDNVSFFYPELDLFSPGMGQFLDV